MKPLEYYIEKYPLLADPSGLLVVLAQVKNGEHTFNRWLRPKYLNSDYRFKFAMFEYLVSLPETLAVFHFMLPGSQEQHTLLFNRTEHEDLRPPTMYTDVHDVSEVLPTNMFGIPPRTTFVSSSLANAVGFIGKPLYFDFYFRHEDKDVTVTVNISHDVKDSEILIDVAHDGEIKSKRLRRFPCYADLQHLEVEERDLKHYIIDYIEKRM